MKLSRGKLLETLRAKNNGATSWQARKIAGVSTRRVNQVWQEYLRTGGLPPARVCNGRPARLIADHERTLVRMAYEQYRVSASTLERLIERDYGIHIGHNRVHKILIELGFAKQKRSRDVRKKNWIRYERRHSLTAVHIDWHQRPNDGPMVYAVEDDASRKLLALLENVPATTAQSILGMEQARTFGPILQCISDHGSQFTNNLDGDSKFAAYLDACGIKQILCRIKHPQSNGKVERWFQTYERHRDAFNTVEEFVHWYNAVRPHRSLRFDELETPNQAFERKRRTEV
jgi:putative transposase